MTQYRIFLSSPGDVSEERNRAQIVIDHINADQVGGPVFSLTRWEDGYYAAHDNFQSQLIAAGKGPGDHDLVIFVFWKRLGTALPPEFNRVDGTSRTGTEYEFEEARDAREKRADQLPDILVYRKTAKVLFSEETLEVERAQKKALDQFWERWFRSDVGQFIAGFQSFRALEDFERQLDRNLREWLKRRRAASAVWDPARQGSPYRGLAAFDENHTAVFFGRDADIGRARARFIEASIGHDSGRRGLPFLLILGASGSGKSSFLRAGLIPRMRAGGAPAYREDGSDGIQAFRSVVVVPSEMGVDLCLGLATALYESTSSADRVSQGLSELTDGDYRSPEAFAALAARSPDSAVAPILNALGRVTLGSGEGASEQRSEERWGLLLAIDQLEELFARADRDRRAFLELLGTLASTGRVWIVATMRNDFYDRLRDDAVLSALTDQGRTYDLAFPTAADYRTIIRQPAEAAGLRFEVSGERDLAAELEGEAGGEGALPVLSFILDELFRQRRGNVLTMETYDRLGGGAGAMANHGEQIVRGLPGDVAEALRRVSRRLVHKSLRDAAPTSNAAPLSAFLPASAEAQLIDALRQARLITSFTVPAADRRGTTAWVRWTHESLLNRWPRLRKLVDDDRRDYETLDRVTGAYALWQTATPEEKSERLLSDLALAEAVELCGRWKGDVEGSIRGFVDASERQQQARTRRRRRAVAAVIASLSVLTLIALGTSLVALRQGQMAQEASRKAEEASREAKEQATTADSTAQLMVSLFRQSDPSENRGEPVKAKEALERGTREINQDRTLEPRIRADLLTAVGQAYAGLGLYKPAEELLEQARAYEAQSLTKVPDEAQVRTMLALGTTLYSSGEYERAATLLRQTADEARRTLPLSSTLRSEALTGLADVLVQLGEYSQAETLCNEALLADRKRVPQDPGVLANSLDSLANVYYYSGNLAKAAELMGQGLSLRQEAFGPQDTRTAESMNNLAVLLYQKGSYDEAIKLYRQALPIFNALYGSEHPQVASLLNNLGRSELMAGDLDGAGKLIKQSLAIDDRFEEPTHDDFVSPLNSLAMIDSYQGRITNASKEISRAERIARLPAHGEFLDQVLVTAAFVDLAQGHTGDAARRLAESHRLLEENHPLNKDAAEAWRYAVWDSVDAELLAARGDVANARRVLSTSQPVIEKRFGPTGFYSLRARQIASHLGGPRTADLNH
jgi:tetratricopeptide (TPR) repeat protein